MLLAIVALNDATHIRHNYVTTAFKTIPQQPKTMSRQPKTMAIKAENNAKTNIDSLIGAKIWGSNKDLKSQIVKLK